MKEKNLSPEDVRIVEMGLTNRCNLRCPLCPYSTAKIYEQKRENLDIVKYLLFLDKLPNLSLAIIEGNYSEPTLYSYLIDLLEYLSKRNIRVRLTTNGNILNELLWINIGQSLGPEDFVRFAIDGSTQELYSHYRVGGNLQRVLNNHDLIKKNTRAQTVLQNIIFSHNKNDKKNIENIFFKNNFDYLHFVKCYYGGAKDSVYMPEPTVNRYYKLFHRPFIESKKLKVICDSYTRKEIYINHKGQIFLCGNLDSGESYRGQSCITDEIVDIFESINKGVNTTHDNSGCRADCNTFCHSVNEKFPDYLLDKKNNLIEVKTFDKEITSSREKN